jgi:hypothetical protein
MILGGLRYGLYCRRASILPAHRQLNTCTMISGAGEFPLVKTEAIACLACGPLDLTNTAEGSLTWLNFDVLYSRQWSLDVKQHARVPCSCVICRIFSRYTSILVYGPKINETQVWWAGECQDTACWSCFHARIGFEFEVFQYSSDCHRFVQRLPVP